jgi:DNA-directed RNA polymerase II subunit RPB2
MTDLKNHLSQLIEEFFTYDKNFELVKHNINSYDDFVEKHIDDIIQGFNPVNIVHDLMRVDQHVGPLYRYMIEIHIKNPVLERPYFIERDGSKKLMTPMMARSRDLTYSGLLNVDIEIIGKTFNSETNEYNLKQKLIKHVPFGKIPIMLRSNYCILSKDKQTSDEECPFDCGGYFIMSGNEKVLIPQDRFAENKPFAFMSKEPAYSWTMDIRSVNQDIFGVPKTTTIKLSSAKKCNQEGRFLRVTMHHMYKDFSLFILFRALGVESDFDIINYIVTDGDQKMMEQLTGSIVEARMQNIMTQSQAHNYLIQNMSMGTYPKEYQNSSVKRMDILRTDILSKEFLPHVNIESTPLALKQKAVFLGKMTARLLKIHMLKISEPDNRDSYLNKRVESSGILMANLFRTHYGKLIRDARMSIHKDMKKYNPDIMGNVINVITEVNVGKIFKHTTIENNFKYCMGTGVWGSRNGKQKSGVGQILTRNNFAAFLSHLRRVNTYIEKVSKVYEPRKLHNSQAGFICPFETPEGHTVGLVKNLSIQSTITCSSNSSPIRSFLENDSDYTSFDGDVKIFHNLHVKNKSKVLINGAIVGVHDNPVRLFNDLKYRKRMGIFNRYIAVFWDIPNAEVCVNTEACRMTRPLLVLNNQNTDLNMPHSSLDVNAILQATDLNHLIQQGIIEYLDVEECNHSLIAMEPKDLEKGFQGAHYPLRYSYMELDSTLMQGIMADSIPFANHNQAPRNAYQSSMAKQAIGLNMMNYRDRFDSIPFHILNYGQVPIVQTRGSRIIHSDKIPSGINAIVAIACYTGSNQEDSLVMNESSVERGLFTSTMFKTYSEVLKTNHGSEATLKEYFTNDINEKSPNNYGKLGKDGFVPVHTHVGPGDVLMGKIIPQRIKDKVENKNTSLVLKNNETGYVDRIAANNIPFPTVNADGYNFGKTRISQIRSPEIGDKFTSRMGQKGTNGILLKQEDMPFAADGTTPDIIINPHAIPSRMTIGQILECLMGRASVEDGEIGDGTPFNSFSHTEDLGDRLEKMGMERHGYKILYNGFTGEQIHTDIFIGPTYYQRLKHMVIDKVHSRSNNGPVVIMTRQPSEGRARDGGLRIGYMEVECMWSHGVMQFLKERFMECSDNYRIFVCKKCNQMATAANPKAEEFMCQVCKNCVTFAEVRLPYACKLLFQEIQAMSVGVKLLT